MKEGITVAYSGVHQAFQLALAAYELGQLEHFYCSLFRGKKWGKAVSRIFGPERLQGWQANGLPGEKVFENPWPLLTHHLYARLRPDRADDWRWANDQFDQWVARCLGVIDCSVFVGVETCARDSFVAAEKRGMTKVLDCPQVHPRFLSELLQRAADDIGMPAPPPFDTSEMAARKAAEFEMADVILLISPVHRRSFIEAGFVNTQLLEIALWVDPELWFPMPVPREVNRTTPLKVIFAGSIGLRKGVPYLVRAMDECGNQLELTLVGVNSGESDKFIHRSRSSIRYAGRKNKTELRRLYWESDVLVLPSLVDTFGFVAMEAMACGLPVIVTENCGVPVPDPSWRVPIMDSHAIAKRLTMYAEDRELCRKHGLLAAAFAAGYTPQQYREQIKCLYRQLLGLPLMWGSSADSQTVLKNSISMLERQWGI